MWVALEGGATNMARSSFPSLPASFPVRRVGVMESLFLRLLEQAERGGPEASRICGCLAEAILLLAAQAAREHSCRHSRRERPSPSARSTGGGQRPRRRG
jgi:hypothetical protein